jgi:HD-like signal output (HDOD) protein/HPt (histidine-containing phosphotransfer) domain-containing protein
MQSNQYLESMDSLSEKLNHFVDDFESSLLDLQNDALYSQTINHIFREVHNLKSLSQYAKIDHLSQALKTIEDIFDILRYKQPPVKQEIVDWLLMIADYFHLWAEDFEEGNYLIEPIDQYTLHMIKTSAIATYKPKNTLANISVLFCDCAHKDWAYHTELAEKVKHYTNADNNAEALIRLSEAYYDLVIFPSVASKEHIQNLQRSIHPSTKLIMLLEENHYKDRAILDNAHALGITHILKSTVDIDQIIYFIEQIINLSREHKWLNFSGSILDDTIDKIDPLPESLSNLLNLANDPNSTNQDILDVLSHDLLLGALIIKRINSSWYGLKQTITCLRQAISLLGKQQIAQIALESHAEEMFATPDLSAYGLQDPKVAFSISNKRKKLMDHWYSKIKLSNLPILSASAFFGNLGQFLLAEQIKKQNKTEQFYNIVRSVGPTVAEAEIFGITAEDITAEIFTRWQLDPTVTQSIKYAYDFQNAPSNIKSYAIANFVVYSSINSVGESIDEQQIHDMKLFLNDLNLDPLLYNSAMEKTNSIELF